MSKLGRKVGPLPLGVWAGLAILLVAGIYYMGHRKDTPTPVDQSTFADFANGRSRNPNNGTMGASTQFGGPSASGGDFTDTSGDTTPGDVPAPDAPAEAAPYTPGADPGDRYNDSPTAPWVGDKGDPVIDDPPPPPPFEIDPRTGAGIYDPTTGGFI